MSGVTQNILWMAGGAALGYWVTRRHLEIEFQKRLDQQIDSTSDFYRRKYDKKLKEQREKDGEAQQEIVEILRSGVSEVEEFHQEQIDKAVNDSGIRPVVMNYQGISADTEMAPSEQVKISPLLPVVDETPQSENENVDVLPPVIISEEAYMEQASGYKQLTRTYYAGDDILATENNKIISNSVRRNTLGDEVLEKLVMGLDGNAEVIYVRNRSLGMEYEIFRDPGMYTEVVGPIGSVD